MVIIIIEFIVCLFMQQLELVTEELMVTIELVVYKLKQELVESIELLIRLVEVEFK
jgi:hypothetical protein